MTRTLRLLPLLAALAIVGAVLAIDHVKSSTVGAAVVCVVGVAVIVLVARRAFRCSVCGAGLNSSEMRVGRCVKHDSEDDWRQM